MTERAELKARVQECCEAVAKGDASASIAVILWAVIENQLESEADQLRRELGDAKAANEYLEAHAEQALARAEQAEVRGDRLLDESLRLRKALIIAETDARQAEKERDEAYAELAETETLRATQLKARAEQAEKERDEAEAREERFVKERDEARRERDRAREVSAAYDKAWEAKVVALEAALREIREWAEHQANYPDPMSVVNRRLVGDRVLSLSTTEGKHPVKCDCPVCGVHICRSCICPNGCTTEGKQDEVASGTTTTSPGPTTLGKARFGWDTPEKPCEECGGLEAHESWCEAEPLDYGSGKHRPLWADVPPLRKYGSGKQPKESES